MAYDLNIRGADFSHGKYAHVFLDRFLITGQVKGVGSDLDVDMADATTLGNPVQNNSPGIPKGNFKVSAVSSPALDFNLQPLKRRQTPIITGIAPRGLSVGAQVRAFPGSFGKDSDKFDEKSIDTNDFEIGTRGDYHLGRILLSPKGTLLSGASGLGPVDDNSAYVQGTFGGALYVWAWDIQGTGNPTLTFSVQHATTSGGTYTNLATTTPFSMLSPGIVSPPQLVYVNSSVTINQFTQISWSSTGTLTGAQVVAVFARSFDNSL